MNSLKFGSFLLLFALKPFFGHAQISWNENFDDNDLSNPIEWLGDTNAFITNSNLGLQLNAANQSSPSFISCRSTIIDQSSWEFYIKLDFSPSASNYAEVYIVSDQQDPLQAKEAYFIRIGGISGSADDVSLYLKQGSQTTELIDGVDGLAGGSSVEMTIKLEKDSNQLWELWVDDSLNGIYLSQGTAYDSSISTSGFFSLSANYTSTRSDKFYWDDISVSGMPFTDTEAIQLERLSVVDSNTLELQLSEVPQANQALRLTNYRIIENQTLPRLINFDGIDSSTLQLHFANSFSTAMPQSLEVKNLSDRFGNRMQVDTLYFIYYKFNKAVFGDLRITEIMADPSPPVALPEVEYLELMNTTQSYFDLSSWSISDPGSIGILESYILGPLEYLLLCDLKDTVLLSSFGNILGLHDFPSLNNSDDQLWLRDSSGSLIDVVNYRSSWYKDALKSSGGYSLEMINPFLKCSGEDNFSASDHPKGGSPAAQNSNYEAEKDLLPPFIQSYQLLSSNSIKLNFNEVLDSSLFALSKFFLNGVDVNPFVDLSENLKTAEINLSEPLDSGQRTTLICLDIYDCEGNKADSLKLNLTLPWTPQKHEIVLNEILFNPKSGGEDFLELYNRSDKIFSLNGMLISNSRDTADLKEIKAEGQLFHPREFWVLSADTLRLAADHPRLPYDRSIQFDLPAFSNEKGEFYLWNQQQQQIEYFRYHEEMHFQLLSSFDGVSLERLDPLAETEAENFFSAAEEANFATPGRPNSQRSPMVKKAIVGLREKIFSPDNDGYQDLLFLDYSFEQSGFVGSIEVLDSKGRRVRKLVNNQLLANSGSFRWDGLDDRGSKVPLGIYLLTFEAFHPSGDVIFKKLPLVVAGMLD